MMTDVALGLTLAAALVCGGAQAQQTLDDDARVSQRTFDFFALRAAGETEQAFDALSDSLVATAGRDRILEIWSYEDDVDVAFDTIEVTLVTWYVNPEGVPAGTYGAVDFRGGSDATPLICGFVIWYEDATPPVIIRQELNYVEQAMWTDMSDEQRMSIAAQFGCQ